MRKITEDLWKEAVQKAQWQKTDVRETKEFHDKFDLVTPDTKG